MNRLTSLDSGASVGIGADRMSGGRHSAVPCGGGWEVSWLPGRTLDRNQAISALVLAGIAAAGVGDHADPLWVNIDSLAGELGLTGAEAIGRASWPPEDADDVVRPAAVNPDLQLRVGGRGRRVRFGRGAPVKLEQAAGERGPHGAKGSRARR